MKMGNTPRKSENLADFVGGYRGSDLSRVWILAVVLLSASLLLSPVTLDSVSIYGWSKTYDELVVVDQESEGLQVFLLDGLFLTHTRIRSPGTSFRHL